MRNQPSATSRLLQGIMSAPEASEASARSKARFSAKGAVGIFGRAICDYADTSTMAHVSPFTRFGERHDR